MLHAVLPFIILWRMGDERSAVPHVILSGTVAVNGRRGAYHQCSSYHAHNVSRSTLAGIAEYRSALTLDWMAAEDLRQKDLALAFQTDRSAPISMLASDCINYEKPASGKVARLMLELLKNLEGDDGTLIPELIQALLHSKLLVETSLLEAEPDLDSLVKTPGVMLGEPHATFPRILALAWIAATDPTTVKRIGWCPINRVTKYLLMTRPMLIAKHMRNLDPVMARARFIIEDFIQHVTPNIYVKNLELAKMQSVNNNQPTSPSRLPKYRIQPLNALRHKDRYPRLNTMHTIKIEPLRLPTTDVSAPLELPLEEFSDLGDHGDRTEVNGARMLGISELLLLLFFL